MIRKAIVPLVTIFGLLLFAALVLGYWMLFGSFTSRDNEANFRMVFGYPRPPDVIVHHSEVWEGRHFLMAESSYYFEVDAPKTFVENLTADGYSAQPQFSDNRPGPSWFAPKDDRAYWRWDLMDGPVTVGGLFIDRETGRIFFYRQDL